jgi:hypothetical protein
METNQDGPGFSEIDDVLNRAGRFLAFGGAGLVIGGGQDRYKDSQEDGYEEAAAIHSSTSLRER